MDLCLSRICDYRNITPRYVNYHNVVLLISQTKDEDFLDLMRLYEELECRLTVLFSFKYHDDMGLFEEVWNMGYKQDQTPVYVEIFSDVAEAFESLYTSCIKPTIIITDDESNGDIIKKNCAWYFVYPFKKVYCRYNMRPIEALCLASLDYDKIPEPRLYANTLPFDNSRVTVSDVIDNIPKCHILFTALGCFKRNYNYAIIISAFTDFMRKSNKIFGHKIMLILHGTSDRRDDKFRRELRRQVLNTPFKKNIILLKKDLNDKEKKALLRMSYALIYLNGGAEPTADLRLSLLVGTPVIALNKGYAKHVCKNGVTGLMMSKLEVTKLSLHMQSMTDPTTYQYFSNSTREYFLYEHTFMKYAVDAFDKEDSPILRRKAQVKGYRYHSNTVTELVTLESETVIELVPRISDMDSIDDGTERGKSACKSRYPSKAIEVFSAQVNAPQEDTKTLLLAKKVSSTRMIQSHSKESKKEIESRGRDSRDKPASRKSKKPSKTKLLIDLMINDLYEKEENSDEGQETPTELEEDLKLVELELVRKKSSDKMIMKPKAFIYKKEEKSSPVQSKVRLSPKPGTSNVLKQKPPPKKTDKPQSNVKTTSKLETNNNKQPNNKQPSNKQSNTKLANNKKSKKHKDFKKSSSTKLQPVAPQKKLKKSESHSKTQTNKDRRKNVHTQSTTTDLNNASTSKLEPPPPVVKLPEKQVKEKKVQTYYNPPIEPEREHPCASLKLGLFSNTERYLEQLNRQK